ncbi:MAG: DUF429 domain-containing protein [Candidatus Odinarchaeia archaeon]
MSAFVGIDLSGLYKNPSGWAALRSDNVVYCKLYSDSEIIKKTIEANPKIIAIDAPLSLPRKGIIRDVDQLMIRRKLRVLPPLIKSMAPLTYRAIKLSKLLRKEGYTVVEVHPTSSLKMLNLPRNKTDLIKKLNEMGINVGEKISVHELDAIICSITAKFYAEGKYIQVSGYEGTIILPKKF